MERLSHIKKSNTNLIKKSKRKKKKRFKIKNIKTKSYKTI